MNGLLNPADPSVLDDEKSRARLINDLRESVQNIMLACSFQDIAGQRIRKTLENINDIEGRITGALEGIGIGPESLKAAAEASSRGARQKGSTQHEIDALFP
jgi:chemotaxis regulatin CheY-phosphate phosphatase CheZ